MSNCKENDKAISKTVMFVFEGQLSSEYRCYVPVEVPSDVTNDDVEKAFKQIVASTFLDDNKKWQFAWEEDINITGFTIEDESEGDKPQFRFVRNAMDELIPSE